MRECTVYYNQIGESIHIYKPLSAEENKRVPSYIYAIDKDHVRLTEEKKLAKSFHENQSKTDHGICRQTINIHK